MSKTGFVTLMQEADHSNVKCRAQLTKNHL